MGQKPVHIGDRLSVDFINKQTEVDGNFKIEVTDLNPDGKADFTGKRKEDGKSVYIDTDSGEVGTEGHVDVEWIGNLVGYQIVDEF